MGYNRNICVIVQYGLYDTPVTAWCSFLHREVRTRAHDCGASRSEHGCGLNPARCSDAQRPPYGRALLLAPSPLRVRLTRCNTTGSGTALPAPVTRSNSACAVLFRLALAASGGFPAEVHRNIPEDASAIAAVHDRRSTRPIDPFGVAVGGRIQAGRAAPAEGLRTEGVPG